MARTKVSTPVIPDELYDLALQYKQTQLWKDMWDSNIFALRLSSGEIGYCCVMGRAGQHNALALYRGERGLATLREVNESEEPICYDEHGHVQQTLQSLEQLVCQDCIQCELCTLSEMNELNMIEVRDYVSRNNIQLRGSNHTPSFLRYRPLHMPWYVTDAQDQSGIAEALRAALAVSERLQAKIAELKAVNARTARAKAIQQLGFREDMQAGCSIPLLSRDETGGFAWSSLTLPLLKPDAYPSPKLPDNDILLARAKKAKQRRTEWLVDLVMIPSPISDDSTDTLYNGEPKEAPFFPFMLIGFESTKGECFLAEPTSLSADDMTMLVRQLAEKVAQLGRPSSLFVREEDPRTFALVSGLCEQLSIPVKECAIGTDGYDSLLEAERLLIQLDHNGDGLDEVDAPMVSDPVELIIRIIQLMSNEQIANLSEELQNLLLEQADQGKLAPAFAKRVRRIFEGK